MDSALNGDCAHSRFSFREDTETANKGGIVHGVKFPRILIGPPVVEKVVFNPVNVKELVAKFNKIVF